MINLVLLKRYKGFFFLNSAARKALNYSFFKQQTLPIYYEPEPQKDKTQTLPTKNPDKNH